MHRLRLAVMQYHDNEVPPSHITLIFNNKGDIVSLFDAKSLSYFSRYGDLSLAGNR